MKKKIKYMLNNKTFYVTVKNEQEKEMIDNMFNNEMFKTALANEDNNTLWQCLSKTDVCVSFYNAIVDFVCKNWVMPLNRIAFFAMNNRI